MKAAMRPPALSAPRRDPRRRSSRAAVPDERQRLLRQFDRLARRWPRLLGWLPAVNCRWCVLVRVPLALALMVGALFSFLPVLGLWMLPVGLMLLALDVPRLQRPVNAGMIGLQRRLRRRRHRGRPGGTA